MAAYTTADYAVQISGLDDDDATYADDYKGTDGLKTRLMRDLKEKLKFEDDDIVQIELGRFCVDEMDKLDKLRMAQEKKEEIAGRIAAIKVQPKPTCLDRVFIAFDFKDSKAELLEKAEQLKQKTQAQIDELVNRLAELADLPDHVTGHAFVVFQTEDKRDECVAAFQDNIQRRRQGLAQRLIKGAAVGFNKRIKGTKTLKVTTNEFESAKKGGTLVVATAAEPDEVIWANLQLDDAHQIKWERFSGVVIVFFCLLGAGLIMALKSIQVTYKEDKNHCEDCAFGSEQMLEYTSVSGLISIISSLVSLGINELLKTTAIRLTLKEGQDTQTDEQRSIFTKLTIAYCLNMVIVPLALGFLTSGNTSGRAVDQAWYEDSGITFTLFTVLLVNTVAVDFMKTVQPVSQLKRRILAPIFKSQAKIMSLFKPPKMNIGELYAATVKTVAMGLMYGTMYPPAYLITAFALFISFWGTRFSISHWFKRPPAVDTDMLDRMIEVLAIVQMASIAMSGIAANAATAPGSWGTVAGPLIASPILWLLYAVAPWSLLSVFAKTDQLSQQGDTKGVRFDQVTKETGFACKLYQCPLLEPGEDAWVGVNKMSVQKNHSVVEDIKADQSRFRRASREPSRKGGAAKSSSYTSTQGAEVV